MVDIYFLERDVMKMYLACPGFSNLRKGKNKTKKGKKNADIHSTIFPLKQTESKHATRHCNGIREG